MVSKGFRKGLQWFRKGFQRFPNGFQRFLNSFSNASKGFLKLTLPPQIPQSPMHDLWSQNTVSSRSFAMPNNTSSFYHCSSTA